MLSATLLARKTSDSNDQLVSYIDYDYYMIITNIII